MERSLKAPKNPEGVGRVIAALRVFTGQRPPRSALERKINEAFSTLGIHPTVARRIVATFDSKPKRTRTKLLGRFGEPDFIPATTLDVRVRSPTTTVVPSTAFVANSAVRGVLSEVFSTNPDARPLPKYTLRYQGFFCESEGRWDRGSLSDEIYIITSVAHITDDAENPVRTVTHPVGQNYYGNVDTDEARPGPVAAIWQGNSDPITLTVFTFEHDEGDPNAYRDEIEALVKGALVVAKQFLPNSVSEALEYFESTIVDVINWAADTGDDLISAEMVVLPRSLLEIYSASRRSFYIGQGRRPVIGPTGQFRGFEYFPITTNLMYHFTTVHKGAGANYVVCFDVERDPPLEVLNPIL